MMTLQDYDRTAQEYLESLPLEHFMESTLQSRQREISLESFALLKVRIPDFQYFSELLVQLRLADGRLVQVVPDNMAILSDEPERDRSSFPMALEKATPFWVLEYVSKNNKRKDYEDSFRKYEDFLQVPYCLLFDLELRELRMFRYNGEGYVRMEPDVRGRFRVDELDVEVGLLEGWIRFWHRGELLLLPRELEQDRQRLEQDRQRLEQDLTDRNQQLTLQADLLQHKDEILAEHVAELAARNEQLRGVQEQQRQVLKLLQQQVAERARRAGRADVLSRLETTTDLGQLGAWLGEMP